MDKWEMPRKILEYRPYTDMLIPSEWLKQGSNELIVFDLYPATNPTFSFLDKPILDMPLEAQAQPHKTKGQKWTLTQKQAYHSGAFENNDQWQKVSFKPIKAQYFCMEALSEYKNQPFTTIAEMVLLDGKGNEIPRTAWKIVYADSEELSEDGSAANVFDLQFTSSWHTEWQNTQPKHPHQVVIDLGGQYTVGGLKLLPRQDSNNGRIKDYNLYFSKKPFAGLTEPKAE